MLRSLLLVFALLLVSTSTYGQRTVSADSQTFEALLQEVRQLRQDLRNTSVTSVRAQILLHRVQIQEDAVVRLSQKAENAEAKLAESQSAQQRVTDQIHALENRKQSTSDFREEQELEHGLESLKRNLQQFGREVQQRQAKASEAEEQLRGEQAKLSELEDQLERLDKELERSVPRSSTNGSQ